MSVINNQLHAINSAATQMDPSFAFAMMGTIWMMICLHVMVSLTFYYTLCYGYLALFANMGAHACRIQITAIVKWQKL